MVKVGALGAGPGEGDGGGGSVGGGGAGGVRRSCQYFCRASWEERATSIECERLNPAVVVTTDKSEGRLDPLAALPHVPYPPQAAR